MNKKVFFITGTLIVFTLLLVIILSPGKLTSFSISSQEMGTENTNFHAWTKAICDKDNFCQDYLIECNDQEPIKLSPITGATVQFSKDWQDSRTLEQRERVCD